MEVSDGFVLDLTSMHGQSIPSGFTVKVSYLLSGEIGALEVADGGEIKAAGNLIEMQFKNGKLRITFNQSERNLLLKGITINQK